MAIAVDFQQVQGLVRFGYRRLTEASFLLLSIRDADAARGWLQSAPISDAVARGTSPPTALQVAFTATGLKYLGIPDDVLAGFSAEFLSGMIDPDRSRLLGDIGPNAPEGWRWGTSQRVPHVLVLLYAQPGCLESWSEIVKGPAWDRAFELMTCLETTDLGGFEPFGFRDGVSQPSLDWERTRVTTNDQLMYSNVLSLGEFLLGYPNEYGRYTERPLIPADLAPSAGLPLAEDNPRAYDLGRNGCYLVLRTLEQDVHGFWRFIDEHAGSQRDRESLAAAMVGRERTGDPLVPLSAESIDGVDAKTAAQNQFTFDSDIRGTRCPLGAHIRRANPRNADLPTPPVYGVERLLRTLGLGQRDLHSDAKASARFHRILRRGREYGPRVSTDEAIHAGEQSGPHGLHFMGLVANIARQFEFLQNAWLMSTKFDAMTDESDPLLGNREPIPGGSITNAFCRPREGGIRHRLTGLPQFVTVKGGAYFFLPSLPAIRYFATLNAQIPKNSRTV